MNWKKILTAALFSGALTLTPAAALTVSINGQTLDAPVFAENGTTYVPLRAAAGLLGCTEVSWSDGTARAAGPGLLLTARPGDQWLEANGRCFYAPDEIQVLDGSVMVPLRALTEAMGGSVSWDAASGQARAISGNGTPEAPRWSEEDLYWLARIISAESRGEPFTGQLAVGTVILNRVASGDFPDSVYDVIFDRRWGVAQFTPVSNGTVYDEPARVSVAAAKLALDGVRAAGESLYFLAPAQAENAWAVQNRPYVTTIGGHQFYA